MSNKTDNQTKHTATIIKKMEENVNFDNEVLAYLSVRKDELIQSHSDY